MDLLSFENYFLGLGNWQTLGFDYGLYCRVLDVAWNVYIVGQGHKLNKNIGYAKMNKMEKMVLVNEMQGWQLAAILARNDKKKKLLNY